MSGWQGFTSQCETFASPPLTTREELLTVFCRSQSSDVPGRCVWVCVGWGCEDVGLWGYEGVGVLETILSRLFTS
jgi:hypothetical protein